MTSPAKARWNRRNRAKTNAYSKAWRDRLRREDPERLKEYYRKHNKIGTARKMAKRDAAATRRMPQHCEVCGRDRKKRRLHWDHDHKTGLFRGWLCVRCNLAAGFLQDSPDLCTRLSLYLRGNARTI